MYQCTYDVGMGRRGRKKEKHVMYQCTYDVGMGRRNGSSAIRDDDVSIKGR
jgi:hypothetical protein